MSANPDILFAQVQGLLDRRDYGAAESALLSLVDEERCRMSPGQRIHYDLLLNECRAFMGRTQEAIPECTRIADELRGGVEHALYARACFLLAVAKRSTGEMPEAAENCNKAVFTYLRIGDTQGVVRALNWLGNIQFDTSEYPQSLKSYRQCIEMAHEAGLTRTVAVARFNMSRPLALSGDLRGADCLLEENGPYLAEHADPLNCTRQSLFHNFVLIQLRQSERARAGLEAFRNELDGLPQRERGAWYEYMGELELSNGNLVEAEEHLLRAIEVGSGDSHDESVIGQSRRLLAEVRLAQGEFDEAMAEVERALEPIRTVGERFEEGVICRVMAEIHARRNQQAEARAAFKQSLDILRDIGAKFEIAKSSLAAGDSDVFSRRERLAYLAEAERLFAESGVEYWIDRTREVLKAVLEDRGDELRSRTRVTESENASLFITADADTLKLLHIAERYARTDIAILITGETGAGKDQLARHLHAVSPRHDQPFVEIDLNTLPESLWESELFGHRKGTFTGATGERIGLLESANGGTVFLNEIGNLPLGLQAKLLEFLDTHQIRRLGETHPVHLDIRFIAATNQVLTDAVANGRFRADLYYRLAEAPVHLKPLRDRRADILPLIRHFMVEFGVPAEELFLLDRQLWVDRACNGHWEGNARVLRNFCYRLVAIADRPSDPEFPEWAMRLIEQIDIIHEPNIGGALSREVLVRALERNGWNQRAAARNLGITESGVRHMMRRHCITRPSEESAAA